MKYAVSKVIDTAMNEVGYLEKKSNADLDSKTGNAGRNNYTKYWRDLAPSMQGEPWCQCFVDWCFKMAFGTAGARALLHQDTWDFYTPTAAGQFKKKGQWHSSPKVGDIIYFKNSQRICHVGLVYKVSGSTVYTIEGNTSNGTAVVANGGGVCKKSYALGNARITGYARPAYTDTNYVVGNKIIARGQKNANKFLKNHLKNPPQIEVDGERGAQTRKQCVRVLQEALNLDFGYSLAVDGIMGVKTKSALNGKCIMRGNKKYLVVAAKVLYQCKGIDKGLKYSRTFGAGLEKTAGKKKITDKDFMDLIL